MDNPLIRTLRTRRLALRLSKQAVAARAGMNRSTFDRYENSCRCGQLEQVEKWAATLGYRVTLVPIAEEIMWT